MLYFVLKAKLGNKYARLIPIIFYIKKIIEDLFIILRESEVKTSSSNRFMISWLKLLNMFQR